MFESGRIGFGFFFDIFQIELAQFQLVVNHSSQYFGVFEERIRHPRKENETEYRSEGEEYSESYLVCEDFPLRRMEFDELVLFDEVERLIEFFQARSEVFEFRYEFALDDGSLEELFFYERLADGFSRFCGDIGRLNFLCHGISVILSIRSRNLR